MLASPGLGHLIPLAELAKLLSTRHGFSVTLFVPTISGQPLHSATAVLKTATASSAGIRHVFLPPVSLDDLPAGVQDEVRIVLSVVRSLGSLRAELASRGAHEPVAAFVSDMFGLEAFELTRGELGIPSYMYFLTSAMTVEFMFYFPTLHEEVSCEFRDMPGPIRLPGCVPLHGRDFIDPVQDRASEAYKFVLRNSKMVSTMADGILLNSFKDLEPETIEDLLAGGPGRPPVYPIGPVIQSGSDGGEDSAHCLEWLGRHPTGSVLFVSFGSGGTLSMEQIHELAHGLETSGERFIWVVRSPEKSASGSFFSGQTREDPLGFLPPGFVDRTRDRGLIVPSWAPQIGILSHPSTGGFLSHCGWNSTLESLSHGVPLIAWPLYAEQRQNAVLLSEGVKVAIRIKAGENGLVEKDEISKVIKSLMTGEEGKTLRLKAKELEAAAKAALGENGSSSQMLAQLALKWKSN